MIHLTKSFKKNILNTFNKNGQQWLTRLPDIIALCINKWKLSECRAVSNMSYNYLCTAKSDIYGDIALKIAVSQDELSSEVIALKLFGEEICCKCFDYDSQLYAYIMERILPGDNLYSVQAPDEQMKIGAQVIRSLPVPDTGNTGLPVFGSLLSKAFLKAQTESKVINQITPFIKQAEQFFKELQDLKMQDLILHGDLHHQNILKTEDNKWKVIDPKGVIGIHPLECGRFIRNHLWRLTKKKHLLYLKKTTAAFAETLGVTKSVILKAAYIDCVLGHTWSLEAELLKNEVKKILLDLKYETELFLSLI